MKLKKINRIFLVCIFFIIVSTFYYFRIFLSPLQILSISEIEKNKQGICLAENRKLSEDELLNRGMQSHFKYLQTAKISLDEADEIQIPKCPEDCIITQLGNYNLLDYLRLNKLNYKENHKGKRIIPQGVKINSFPINQFGNYINFRNKQNNLFSLYASQNRWDDFYPNDCCKVNTLDFYKKNGLSLENAPKYWRSIGKGNFYLTIKYLSMNAGTGKSITLNYETISLDNCGNINKKYFNEKNNNDDLKKTNITDFNFFWYLGEWNYIPKEKLDNQCVLMDSKLPHFLKGYELVAYNNQLYFCNLKLGDTLDWK
ncbi:hypothetical protein BWP33_10645 [Simonsiella muelleri ATCC 29453]|uniref:hypothetical protein n=1 Tax=Simonsiella muelleri TaxID=72 RepID=UPI000CDC7BDE|nr:hypothetical protein [Simonsiella muelleri]AUX62219.1 hypothetical protein BWP33_10645 [Simonsiella muelleri ATCC 29453]